MTETRDVRGMSAAQLRDEFFGLSDDRALVAYDEMKRRGIISPDAEKRLAFEVFASPEQHLRWNLVLATSALENYGMHHPWCGVFSPLTPCMCGLDAAIADARHALAREVTPPAGAATAERDET